MNDTTKVWSRVFRGDLDAAADSLKVHDATAADKDLILHAWAVCWVTGRNDAWDCLFKHLEGKKRTTIRMKSGDRKSFSAGPTRGIRICIPTDPDLWLSEYDPDGVVVFQTSGDPNRGGIDGIYDPLLVNIDGEIGLDRSGDQ